MASAAIHNAALFVAVSGVCISLTVIMGIASILYIITDFIPYNNRKWLLNGLLLESFFAACFMIK